jgi:hypothetical protein
MADVSYSANVDYPSMPTSVFIRPIAGAPGIFADVLRAVTVLPN